MGVYVYMVLMGVQINVDNTDDLMFLPSDCHS